MRWPGSDGNHDAVSAFASTPIAVSQVQRPRLYRRPDTGLVGGVATGIAEHVGLSTRAIRVAFVFLAVAGGLGVALYGAYWIVVPPAPDAGPGRLPSWAEYTLAALAAGAAVVVTVDALPAGALFGPAMLACIGGALIWRQASDPERERLRAVSRTSIGASHVERLGRARLVVGVALVVAGAAFVLARADVTGLRDGFIAMLVTVAGAALLTGPWWIRVMTQLSDERAERIRSQERAELAAHLHDSVLQTLALIQRNAESPREVARLARGQERELRTLLYGPAAASGQLARRLHETAAEVEDAYAVSVDIVVVGDAPLDDSLAAVVAATREGLINAAKHSGTTAVSVYAEVEPNEVSVFVRDRGVGFDPDAVAADRQGVRGSIVGRIERHGGEVRIRSAAGSGTELEIRMPT
jgi:signal transduction histidine kinase/phage shock protein PspC (stress-responsive transcriptional regulator)